MAITEDNKREKIILTIMLTAVEGLVSYVLYRHNIINTNSWWIVFLSYVTPVGFLCFLNYYIFSPVFLYIAMRIWCWFGHYERISRKFSIIATQCVTWLNNIKHHWGVVDTAKECQNANTCEGILAIKKTKLDLRYKISYKEALDDVLRNITDKGLASKSLNHETVVCTAMILYIYTLESKTSVEILQYKEKINTIVQNLWSVRCNKGWGVFVEKTNEDECIIANTFWALRALNEFPISRDEEYRVMLRRIYEYANDSLFGYVIGDFPRLCTTAMSVVLYYNLDECARNVVKEVYDVKKAVDFVYKMFCHKGIECELEILSGVGLKSPGAKKAPWTHVTIGFVSEALVYAYKNKDLGLLKMNNFLRCVKNVCKKRLIYVNGNDQQCYYVPKDMETNNLGIYTFPTAYMAWALSVIDFN